MTLREWDLSTIPNGAVMCIVGRRGVGKSMTIENLAWHLRHRVERVVVFSETERMNGHYARFIPRGTVSDPNIYPCLDKQALSGLLERQKRDSLPASLLIILDDVFASQADWNDPVIRELFFNGLHYGIYLMFTLQYCADLPRAFRSNVDLVVAHHENMEQTQRRLYDGFFGRVFESQDLFAAALVRYTANYGTLVLDNRVRSTQLDQCVFWFRANPHLGSWATDGTETIHRADSTERETDETETQQVSAAPATIPEAWAQYLRDIHQYLVQPLETLLGKAEQHGETEKDKGNNDDDSNSWVSVLPCEDV